MSECKHGVESLGLGACYNCVLEESDGLRAQLKSRDEEVEAASKAIDFIADHRDRLKAEVAALKAKNGKMREALKEVLNDPVIAGFSARIRNCARMDRRPNALELVRTALASPSKPGGEVK